MLMGAHWQRRSADFRSDYFSGSNLLTFLTEGEITLWYRLNNFACLTQKAAEVLDAKTPRAYCIACYKKIAVDLIFMKTLTELKALLQDRKG
jgi:hypothetical protein